VFGLQPHYTASGVQTHQNAGHSFAGYTYTNRETLEGAGRSPNNLGERGREVAQETDRTQREGGSREWFTAAFVAGSKPDLGAALLVLTEVGLIGFLGSGVLLIIATLRN
jgi:hypothetical protein